MTNIVSFRPNGRQRYFEAVDALHQDVFLSSTNPLLCVVDALVELKNRDFTKGDVHADIPDEIPVALASEDLKASRILGQVVAHTLREMSDAVDETALHVSGEPQRSSPHYALERLFAVAQAMEESSNNIPAATWRNVMSHAYDAYVQREVNLSFEKQEETPQQIHFNETLYTALVQSYSNPEGAARYMAVLERDNMVETALQKEVVDAVQAFILHHDEESSRRLDMAVKNSFENTPDKTIEAKTSLVQKHGHVAANDVGAS